MDEVMEIYLGALDPEALVIDVEPGEGLPDLSIVAGADVVAYYGKTQLGVWTVHAITNQTPSTLRLTHLFQAGDVDNPARLGVHRVLARLYVGTQVRRCVPVDLKVLPVTRNP